MIIKICGIRDARSGGAAAAAGADAVGFVFASSPRRVAPGEARRIASDLPADLLTVAVFRLASADEIRGVLDEFGADHVQVEPHASLAHPEIAPRLLPVLHDDENLEAAEELAAGLVGNGPIVLEGAGRGGRGVRPDWTRATGLADRRRVWLAGGLTPENVANAIARVRPWGVDVSSGVEAAPGVKSADRIAAFVREARRAAHAENIAREVG